MSFLKLINAVCLTEVIHDHKYNGNITRSFDSERKIFKIPVVVLFHSGIEMFLANTFNVSAALF